jgi:hypothetical protein
MDRKYRSRISKFEELLSVKQTRQEEKRKKLVQWFRYHARFHAAAVAAIVLSGQPKPTEPLTNAWKRALQHYEVKEEFFANATQLDRQESAAGQLFHVIKGDAEESVKFTEIFSTAPGWLMKFTNMFLDACFLKFTVPLASAEKWGRLGYEAVLRWPLLPMGMMTDGDPVSDEEARRWPFPLDPIKKPDPGADTASQRDDSLSREDDDAREFAELYGKLALDPNIELPRRDRIRVQRLFSRYHRESRC